MAVITDGLTPNDAGLARRFLRWSREHPLGVAFSLAASALVAVSYNAYQPGINVVIRRTGDPIIDWITGRGSGSADSVKRAPVGADSALKAATDSTSLDTPLPNTRGESGESGESLPHGFGSELAPVDDRHRSGQGRQYPDLPEESLIVPPSQETTSPSTVSLPPVPSAELRSASSESTRTMPSEWVMVDGTEIRVHELAVVPGACPMPIGTGNWRDGARGVQLRCEEGWVVFDAAPLVGSGQMEVDGFYCLWIKNRGGRHRTFRGLPGWRGRSYFARGESVGFRVNDGDVVLTHDGGGKSFDPACQSL